MDSSFDYNGWSNSTYYGVKGGVMALLTEIRLILTNDNLNLRQPELRRSASCMSVDFFSPSDILAHVSSDETWPPMY